MTIDRKLLSEFVKITNDNREVKNENVYGTVVVKEDSRYVKIDGSDILTPIYTTTDIADKERVVVEIKNHQATVMGNLTNPSAGGDRVTSNEDSIGRFDHLFAGNITAENIQAGSITTEKLMAGSITADKIATGAITAGSGIIAEGAIGSAQINDLDAGKINSGTVNTSNVTIEGANGNLKMKGNRIQVFQGMGPEQFERVSIGDVNADGTVYGLRVRGADGTTTLLDENGVTSEGITDGSITNDKINPDAGIEGGKLNIGSVIDKINEDGSKTINSIKIDIDGKGLSTVVQEINDKSTELESDIAINKSDIKVNSNAIKMKVDEQIYTQDKDTMTSNLEKNTADINILKDEIKLKVEQTDITTAIQQTKEEIEADMVAMKKVIDGEIDDVSGNLTSLGTYMETAFKDGVLDEQEREVLKIQVLALNSERDDVLSQINSMIDTYELQDTDELIALNIAKTEFISTHEDLLTTMNIVINGRPVADGEIGKKWDLYTKAIDLLRVAMHNCSDKIAQVKADKAESDANSYIDTKVAEIKITTDSITSTVESIEKNTSNNLLPNTNFAASEGKTHDWRLYVTSSDAGGWYTDQHAGFLFGEGLGISCNKAGGVVEAQSSNIRVRHGENYTLSADILVEYGCGMGKIYFREFKKDGTWVNAGIHEIQPNTEGRHKWTHTIVGEETVDLQILFVNIGPSVDSFTYVVFFFNRVQLEKGLKETPWGLCKLDNLEHKFTKIKQTTDGIQSTVSDVQEGQSQLTQTVNGFEFKINSAGKANMLRNSDFTRDLTLWSNYNCSMAYGFGGAPKSYGVMLDDCSGHNQTRYIHQYLDLRSDTPGAYTFSGHVWTSHSDFIHGDGKEYPMCNIYLVVTYSDNTYDWFNYDLRDNSKPGIWRKFECTFQNTKPVKSIEFYVYKRNCSGVMYVTQLKAEEGWGSSNWTPSPNEIFSGITTVDGEGVRVNHDSGDFSQMTSQGFKRHRSDGALKGDYHYLMHQGTIFANSEQTVRIHLPSDFHNKRINVVAAAACIGNGNDAWDKPEPLVSFWAEVTAYAADSSWVDFYASTRQNNNGSILTQHKGIKFAYWVTA